MKQHFKKYWIHYTMVTIGFVVFAAVVGRQPKVKLQSPVLISPVASESAQISLPTTNCDQTLWKHIYNPSRLQVIEFCKTVTGTVDFIRHEADGDLHIGLRLDSQYTNLVNSCNLTCLNGAEHGDLVIEPICESTPTQRDVIDQGVCNGFSQNFQVKIGDHVTVTGALVLDQDHGWVELHPLTKLEVN